MSRSTLTIGPIRIAGKGKTSDTTDNQVLQKEDQKKNYGTEGKFSVVSSFGIADCLKKTGYTPVFAQLATTYSLYPEISGLTQM